MDHKRVLILSAAIGSGHKTAAKALETAFRRRPHVTVVNEDVLEMTNETYRIMSAELYLQSVKHVPWLVGWTYQYNDEPFKNEEPMRKLWDQLNTQPVVKFLKEYRPDICVCTHFTPAGIVAQLVASGQLDTALSVVTTDYDFQGMWLSRTFTRYFVAREEARARLIDFDVNPDRVTVSGIPVNEQFGQPLDRQAVLDTYELDGDLPIILVSAGAVGGGPARAIVAQLMRLNVQVVVVCGSNADLRREVEALTLPLRSRFRVLGFTSDMPDLVRAATLFIGKPGGLTASECMAAGTPLAIVMPIPGQEERNSDYLLEEGAAVRCNDIETVSYKIGQLLANPQRLAKLRENARRIGRADAAALIAATTLADENAPVKYNWRTQKRMFRNAPSDKDPLANVERMLFGTVGGVEESLALYEDETGIYLGTLAPAQYRALRKHVRNLDDELAITVLTRDDLDRIRKLGLGSDLVDKLDRRIHFHGPITLRRVRITA
ncbi:MAG: glycosyltransferase [Roseiflexaceae bacterium]|nr:glycosyltransferase [Roseiflexaceae bacterium]